MFGNPTRHAALIQQGPSGGRSASADNQNGMSYLFAMMMVLCPRPQPLWLLGCAPRSVLRCSSTSCRSWPVSAMRSMADRGDRGRDRSRRVVRHHRGAVGAGVGGLEAGHVLENARTIAAVAHRLPEFPRCAAGCGRAGCRWIRSGSSPSAAAQGSDEHYAELAAVATVSQLRTAVKLEPRPEPDDPRPEPQARRSPRPRATSSSRPGGSPCRTWRRRSSRPRWPSHRDALVAALETRPRRRRPTATRRCCRSGAAVPEHRRCVHEPGRRRLGYRGGAPPARAAHHRGRAPRRRKPRRRPASGSAAVRRRPPLPALRCDL